MTPLNNTNISDEHLNAFVDGQLDTDEKSRVFSAINEDEDLNRRACELRKLRDLVRHAYGEPPAAAPRASRRMAAAVGTGLRRTAVAGLLVALGVAGGWYSRAHVEHNQLQAMFLDKDRAFETADLHDLAQIQKEKKVILHISSANPQRIRDALDMAEHLLKTYKAHHERAELEVVANAGGLNLLRSDTSQFAGRIKRMQQQYANLAFLACRNAMEHLKKEKGVDVKLLPQALVTPSALDEILTRLQEGWVYIRA
ncbi:MAG TPA: hypothetical protein VKA14_02315 [Gammaproteobacteria bacterium]|nr:hypothetical protein [Gammaproteobacteria bacterium]